MDEVEYDEGEIVEWIIPRQTIVFYDEFRVEFDQVVDASLDVLEYHYVCRRLGEEPLLRLDKHPGHEDVAGGLTHEHRPDGHGGEAVGPAPEYDFDDALDYLRRTV